jgi:hypothetical protein
MKVHFYKYLNFLETFFIVLFGLFMAKTLGFDFTLDLKIFFQAFFYFLLFFVFLESVSNRKEITRFVGSELRKAINQFLEESEASQRRIASFSPVFSGDFGRILSLTISYLVTFLIEARGFIKKYVFSKYNLLALFLFGLLAEIFLITTPSDLITLSIMGVWIITVRLFKFKGRASIIWTLIFLASCPFLLIFNNLPFAEKLARWAYMFLMVGVLQTFWEIKEQISQSDDSKV